MRINPMLFALEANGRALPTPDVARAQLEEAIQVCKLLWTRERSDFDGQHFTLSNAVCEPKPVQRPHPAIWVGGRRAKSRCFGADPGH